MNSLHNKWLSRRFKHELSTKQMAVKTNQLTAICVVESSCFTRLDCHFFCREFMFDSSGQPFSRGIKHELSTKEMAVKTNQTWTLYKTNGSQDESIMNSLQKKWQSRGIKHELSTKDHVWFVLTAICFVESSCLIGLDSHLFCREFMFDSFWLLFVL
jgi:hypothetical protein